MTKQKIKTVEWRLWALMADRGIRSSSELAEMMLSRTGHEISPTHMSRYTKANPPALTLKMIGALLTTLNATPEELFRVSEQEVEINGTIDRQKGEANEVERRTRIKGAQPSPAKPSSSGPRLVRLNEMHRDKKN